MMLDFVPTFALGCAENFTPADEGWGAAGPVEGLEQALTGPILDTYEVTRAAPGGVWVMRAMRAMLAEVCSAPPDARAYARAAVHFLIAANKGGGSPSGHRDDREAVCSSWWVQRR
jgi:hypothetical protein